MNYVSNRQLELLCSQWDDWRQHAGVPEISAEDLVHSAHWKNLSPRQRAWVSAFIIFWDATVG